MVIHVCVDILCKFLALFVFQFNCFAKDVQLQIITVVLLILQRLDGWSCFKNSFCVLFTISCVGV